MAAELQFGSDPQQSAWAHAGRAELAMLELARLGKPPTQQQRDEVIDHVRQVLEAPGVDSFVIYSTRRQFGRYVDWWSQPLAPHGVGNGLNTFDVAKQVFERLSG